MFDNYNEKLLPLDGIKLNFNETGLMIMNITIAFIMFGVALGIKRENFQDIVKDPKPVVTGVISQFILMPAITFLIVMVAKLPVSISLGMLLVASCPGGNVSNFMTSLARGNVALSVSLTAIADLASIIMTPLSFTFWGNLYIDTLSDIADPIHIPFIEVLKTVTLLMGVPLVLGLWFQNKFPKTTKRIFKTVKIVSFVIFLGFIAGAIAANFEHFAKYFWLIFPIVLIHNILAFATGFSISGLLRLSLINRKTITIETGIQNSGIALVLIFNNKIFPDDGYGGIAFIAAMWGIWHIASGLIISTLWSYRNEPVNETVLIKEK
ncbi:MAG: bile acid:sodium symporter family protein [Bacteroidales bacterium]|nr:bile acid:sodium symporter family protein [Bacteroidales bacterium]